MAGLQGSVVQKTAVSRLLQGSLKIWKIIYTIQVIEFGLRIYNHLSSPRMYIITGENLPLASDYLTKICVKATQLPAWSRCISWYGTPQSSVNLGIFPFLSGKMCKLPTKWGRGSISWRHHWWYTLWKKRCRGTQFWNGKETVKRRTVFIVSAKFHSFLLKWFQ